MFNKNAFVFLKPVLTDFITLLTWYEDMMNKILWYYMVQGRNVSLFFFFLRRKRSLFTATQNDKLVKCMSWRWNLQKMKKKSSKMTPTMLTNFPMFEFRTSTADQCSISGKNLRSTRNHIKSLVKRLIICDLVRLRFWPCVTHLV